MHGFCHIELPTTNLDSAQEFYGNLFGWQIMPIPGMEYRIFSAGEGNVGGGLMKVDSISQTEGVYSYVEVEDIPAVLEKAKSLGGTIVQEKQVLPDASWGATGLLKAPDGYTLGLWSKS